MLILERSEVTFGAHSASRKLGKGKSPSPAFKTCRLLSCFRITEFKLIWQHVQQVQHQNRPFCKELNRELVHIGADQTKLR